MKSKIWLSSPHMGGNEERYVKEAFETNWIAPAGPNISGFENDLESYLSQDSLVTCLSSGTAAIHLALIQLGVKQDDEVLCQSFTFVASANPILYVGATPIFIDSELDTWNMSPVFLERAILDRISKGKKPKAIILVHLYGMPAKMEKILRIANHYGIPIIEDAAEALGSKYKGRKCGTFGRFSVLSFNGNKIITTSGGGAIVAKTKEEKERSIFYATQAKENEGHYEHCEIGFNYRMSNVCAGIGRGQMKVVNIRVAQRQANHSFYQDLFKNNPLVSLFKAPSKDYQSNYWLSCILVDEKAGFSKYDIINHLDKNNIESRSLWKPMHLQPVFKTFPFYGAAISDDLFKRGLCLPSGSNMTIEEREKISRVLTEFVSTYC